jgi:hypothetical protein
MSPILGEKYGRKGLNKRAHLKLTGLRGNPQFLSMFSCSVDMRWGFRISTPQHSASWFISLHGLICLSYAVLRCLRPHNVPLSTSRLLTFITASTRIFHYLGSPVQLSPSYHFPRRHLLQRTHCCLPSLHFRSHPQRSGLPITFHYPRALTGSMVGCLLLGKALS